MRKNKKILKKATIGTSLLMSTVLLCGNTLKTYAQADLTPEVPTPTPNPTPNPTLEPEHPVEDNTPVVPTPTPEPNQPGNPTNPVEETPVNPTPESEKPVVVEEEKHT